MSGSQTQTYTDGGVTYTTVTTPGLSGPFGTLTISYDDGQQSSTINNVTVLTASTINVVNFLNFSTCFIPPGITANLNIDFSAASSPTFYVAGNVTVTNVGSFVSGMNYFVTGPSAKLQIGTGISLLTNTTITLQHGGSFEIGLGAVSALSKTTINFDQNGTGGTFIFNNGNNLINFNGHNALINLSTQGINNFGSSPNNRIEFQDTTGSITGYQVVNTTGFLGIPTGNQEIILYSGTTEVAAININGTSLTAGNYSFNKSGPLAIQFQPDGTNADVFIDPVGGTLSHDDQTINTSQTDQGIQQDTIGNTINVAQNVSLTVQNSAGIESINNQQDVINVAAGGAIDDDGGLDNSNNGTLNLAGGGTLSVNSTDTQAAINNENGGTIIAGTGEVVTDQGGLQNSNAVVDLTGASATIAGIVNNENNGQITLNAGSTLATSSQFLGAGGTIAFQGADNTLSAETGQNLGTITGFGGNDEIDLSGTSFSTHDRLVSNGNVISVVDGTTTLATFNTVAGEAFSLTSGPNGVVELGNDALVHDNQNISQSQTVGLLDDGPTTDGSIGIDNGSTLTVTSAGADAMANNDGDSIDVSKNGGIQDDGGVNNSDDGVINLGDDANATVDGTINNTNDGTINLDTGSTLVADSAFDGSGGKINFQGTGDQLNVLAGQNLGTISGFGSGDEINLAGVTYNSGDKLVAANGTESIVDNGTTLASFNTVAGETFELAASPTDQLEIVCFLAGTRIATPDGETEVQSLKAGDLVRTASGNVKRVRWLGRSTVVTRFADPLRAAPIRITAGALGENLPTRDLLVSPAHAMFINNILVQAGAMVNGTSIRREVMPPDSFAYYHVELDEHELILAEGAPCESFVDNVDRMNFDNWSARDVAEMPEPIIEMAYPRAKSARQVPQPVRHYLAERAALLTITANAA